MKVYEGKDIRNVGVVGHGHSGKTSLTAALLYTAGATNRLTRADEGNTITDFDDEEIQRKITISTAVALPSGRRTRSICSIRRASTSSSTTRRRAGRRRFRAGGGRWRGRRRSADRKGLGLRRRVPAAARHLHQQARSRALEFRARARKHPDDTSAARAVPIQLPIGAEREFKGVVDLVRMKAYTYTAGWRRQGQRSRRFPPTWPTPRRRRTKRWWRWWPKATTR